jgi:hypothetical protein
MSFCTFLFLFVLLLHLFAPGSLAKSKEKKPGLSGPACPTVGREV